ncbi:MAG TPA: carboxypeptidase-like regulatory domain-containing protein, partial [Membranihabitans sp.]|nr:carboxypeptidase-like regulatory domain-containing protein [Membranihabitans sp.]
MMWKYGLLLLLLGPLATHAQNLVTGTVTENLSGSTLIGVNILVKGTTTGAVTDVDGQYQISASLNDTLIF